MEPTIKYENCEDLYTGAIAVPNGAIKRNYSEASSENHYHLNASHQMQAPPYRNNFYGTPPAPPPQPEVSQFKRYRRGDSAVLFGPPFFELQQEYDTVNANGTLTARCLTCHVVLRGHKNVSSNFIKHMKRVHPEVHQIYENIKILKYRGSKSATEPYYNVPNSSAPTETDAAGFFDASAFLEHMSGVDSGAVTVTDEEHNSETTENSGTPPNSTEVTSETPENSTDTQPPPLTPLLRLAAVVAGCNKADKNTKADDCAKVDLSHNTLDMMSQMLDEKLKAFVTKTEYQETTQIISNLVEKRLKLTGKCNEPEKFSDCSTQSQLTALKQECQELRAGKRQLQRELQAMDREQRKHRLVIRNIHVQDNETTQQTTERLLRERLELPDIKLTKATLLGAAKPQGNKQNVLIELANACDARTIFKNCFKLKNTGVFIEPDMSPHARKRKEKLLVLRKELLRRNDTLKVSVCNTQLIVGGKHFYWDEVEGLCIGGRNSSNESNLCETVMYNREAAVTQLQTLTGLDLREFLNVLKNYDVQMR